MAHEDLEHHTYESRIDCHYLLRIPAEINASTLLIAALHGYGSNASDMMRLITPVVGQGHVIASLQGPHQHYGGQPGVNSQPAYNWGIRQHWHSAVRLHHEMVHHVLSLLHDRFSIGAERTVLAGFSQPGGLNYRFAATYPNAIRGVIGMCAGVPRDWEEGAYGPVHASLLHIAREEDEFYPAATARTFAERLRKRASDVEFHMLPGGHRFPSKAGPIIQAWLQRVLPSAATPARNSLY